MKHNSPHILLINPWITDFAAYNFWIKPLGLLYIASLLRENGFRVTLIDCLDYVVTVKPFGDGKFFKTRIEKPPSLKSIPRNYSQYGLPEEILLKRFSSIEEKPDLIGVSSGMTYWYPGVFKIIEITRKFFKKAPVILGGIYATLCFDHAKKYSGADIVFKIGSEWQAVELISELTGFKLKPEPRWIDGCHEPRWIHGCPEPNMFKGELPILQSPLRTENLPYPSFDLYPNLDYVCIATSRGCPFRCTYCASPILSKGFVRRNPFKVVDEIEYWITHFSIDNIAFFDDALLCSPSEHFIPMMKELIRRGIHCKFHIPNALHVRDIDEEVATLLYQGRFKTIRLGLETSNEEVQIETGGKVDNDEFRQAIKYLKKAGYSRHEIGVYVMAGMPGQMVGEVEESIAFVRETGAKPILVEYSPIPHTPLFEKAKKLSQFDIENEPLYQNNSIFPCQWDGFTLSDFKRLKENIKED